MTHDFPRVLVMSEAEHELLVSALNDKRNQLLRHDCNDRFVDELLLKVIDAPQRGRPGRAASRRAAARHEVQEECL